jgi:hypothetical protein
MIKRNRIKSNNRTSGGNVGRDFTKKNKFSDEEQEETKDYKIDEALPASRTKESDIDRLKQMQLLQTADGIFSKRKDGKFVHIIDNDDGDLDNLSSDEQQIIAEKRKPEPMPAQYLRQSNDNSKNHEVENQNASKRQISRSPIRKSEYKRQEGMLEDWERKYGGKNKRQFYKDQKSNMNSWQEAGDGGQYKKPLIDHQDSPDSPKGGVHITGDTAREFEYDWDEATPKYNEHKMRKHQSSKVNNSRVPYGASPFANDV